MRTNLFLGIWLAFLAVCSCSKSICLDPCDKSFAEESYSESEALESFAIILSQAVVDNVELRDFLKEEALKQFDRDYDVFYPFVRNHEFPSGETFEDLLLPYEQYIGHLDAIVSAVPKLTILVPDFSWIDSGCFSVNTWDTTIDYLCVGFDDCAVSHSLYYDGKLLGSLPASSIPAFPVLIIKSNERMQVSQPSTKAAEYRYYFADPAFDGSVLRDGTKGHIEGYLYNTHMDQRRDLVSEIGDFISHDELSSISPNSVQAFNEFGVGSLTGVQRDYIFYGMTNANPNNGALNVFMRDMIYRFRLTPSALFYISDYENDPQMALFWTGRDDRPGFDEALSRWWGNGNYEIRFQYYQDSNGGEAGYIGSNVLSIAPGDLMFISKCYSTFDWNFWGNNWSSYSLSAVCVEPKWYYPGDYYNPLPLVNTAWNMATSSDNIWIKVLEYDPSATESYTVTKAFKQSFSVSLSANGSFWEKCGLGVSGSYGVEHTESKSFTVTKTTGSDDLGDCDLNYVDNIIIASTEHDGNSGFVLKSIGNEYFSVSYVPIDTRNEYQIRQFLLGRKSRTNQ